MREKHYSELLQIRLTAKQSSKLREARKRTGLSTADLTRLSLRWALPRLVEKLPTVENDDEVARD